MIERHSPKYDGSSLTHTRECQFEVCIEKTKKQIKVFRYAHKCFGQGKVEVDLLDGLPWNLDKRGTLLFDQQYPFPGLQVNFKWSKSKLEYSMEGFELEVPRTSEYKKAQFSLKLEASSLENLLFELYEPKMGSIYYKKFSCIPHYTPMGFKQVPSCLKKKTNTIND